jgi:UDP-N-acetylmuramoyl-tripeptide--D-alanyl-D-alanine ligase
VIDWDAARLARAGGAHLLSGDRDRGPTGASIDSRAIQPGELFVGLAGERADGGAYAAQALGAGAWGVLVAPEHAEALARTPGGGVVLAHEDPLEALQTLARAWRQELGARVVAITGSTGKTSTKDILAALLAPYMRTVASPQNLNTEIGLPLAVLAAPMGTEALVLELAMRGAGQIAQLTAIAQPDVGVIVNIGPVHLELLGSLEAVAAAKAELIGGLASASTVILPHGEPLLEPYQRADLRTVTFGAGGDVRLLGREQPGVAADSDVAIEPDAVAESSVAAESGVAEPGVVTIAAGTKRIALKPSFAQSHNLSNLLAAVAAAQALGVTPAGELEVRFSALRGERHALTDEIVLIDDCYNANPMSMRAALDELAACAPARRVAVLGDMLELGSQARSFHREVGAYARERGVELLLTVGPLAGNELGAGFGAGAVHSVPDAESAAELLPSLLHPRDTVLVKGSRGIGLERVAQTLMARRGAAEQALAQEPAGG